MNSINAHIGCLVVCDVAFWDELHDVACLGKCFGGQQLVRSHLASTIDDNFPMLFIHVWDYT